MSNVEDLVREFRADQPGPAEGAAERILERARRAQAPPAEAASSAHDAPASAERAARPGPRRPRRWLRLRWALPAVAAGLAVSLVVALVPIREGSDAPTLLERAEAAIVRAHRIVDLTITVRSTTTGDGVVNPNRTIKMRQWTLAGAGRAGQTRILISEGPLDKAPTDEDSTVLTDRTGRIVDERSWTPLFVRARDNYDYPNGGGRGELEIGGPGGIGGGPVTLVDRLLDAYRSGDLKPSGRTARGDLRFTIAFGDSNVCTRMALVLDARSLLPRRFVESSGTGPCGSGAPPISREVWTIGEARSLPATPANRKLLEIGDWPTERTVRWVSRGRSTPLKSVPPVPKLDEGR